MHNDEPSYEDLGEILEQVNKFSMLGILSFVLKKQKGRKMKVVHMNKIVEVCTLSLLPKGTPPRPKSHYFWKKNHYT